MKTQALCEHRNRRILIVDDTAAIHEDFHKILGAQAAPEALTNLRARLFDKPAPAHRVSFVLTSAHQGQEAVDMARQAADAGEPFAMAFVDMRMPPGWDGLETIGRLWQIDPRMQIVICTAYSDHSWEDIIGRLGHTDCLLLLKKPFDANEVSQLALALTEKWHLTQKAQIQRSELEMEVQRRTQELAGKTLQLESEVVERRRAEDQLKHAATHDALTDLPNRAAILDALAREVQVAAATEQAGSPHVAVIFLDIDNFKTVNDSLGHGAGDQLLIQAAQRLSQTLAQSPGESTLARLGGDEFVILLRSERASDDAATAAEGIRHAFLKPFVLEDQEFVVSMSVGIVLAERRKRADELLRDADTAMYRAKTAGKARYAVFDEVMHSEVMGRLDMESSLRGAMKRGQFELHYQPIVACVDARTCGFEALLRWNHPVRGVIGPSEFIPIAEEIGAIVPIGRWVLQEAVAAAIRWNSRSSATRPMSVSVNISRRQLADPSFIEDVTRALEVSGLPSHLLHLEITESVILANPERMVEVMQQLRSMGVKVLMDNFGTGHSSLSCLHAFPLDMIKIDRSYINAMSRSRQYTAIVNAIVTLADNLGLSVVAEGIETPDQLAQVLALNCQFAQGYLFSPPVDAARVEGLIERVMQRTAA